MIVFENIKGYTIADEVRLASCGEEECTPSHSFGPYIRDFYLIHLVTSGKGRFYICDKEYVVEEGELFLIPPDICTTYTADNDAPWSYIWIGLSGMNIPSYISSAELSKKAPVVKYSKSLLKAAEDIIEAVIEHGFDSIRVVGYVYFFIDELLKCGNSKDVYKTNSQIYVENAVKYINDNIYMPVSVEELAGYIGIDRSYLSRIFKGLLGETPQQYILNMKIEKAKEFLISTNYPIKYIANSVGYRDPFVFSHLFKMRTGLSPKDWRNLQRNN